MTSIESKTTWGDRLAARWNSVKPIAFALAIGLVAGPLISNYVGWQVTRGSAERQSQASAIEQQALICAAQARLEVADTAALDWSARSNLAEKHAVMPGRTAADSGVASACGSILAKPA